MFLDLEVEEKVLLQCHMIDGRLCDIKIPEKEKRERKLNPSQLTEEKQCYNEKLLAAEIGQ